VAGLAWTAASAHTRMANLAVEAGLELGRRERLGRALLDALTDPTAVLGPQGRIVAVNQAWVRFAAEGQAGQALGEVGHGYPAACEAASHEVTVIPWPTATARGHPPPDAGPHGARSVR
jgi:hypothetical protein